MSETKTCPACGVDKNIECFYKVKRYRKGYSYCIECVAAKNKALRKTNGRKWNIARAEKAYGLSAGWFTETEKAQEGKCAICQGPPQGGRGDYLVIDHDHVTGKVRSLLCGLCNIGLGVFRDNPAFIRAAANYIEKWETENNA